MEAAAPNQSNLAPFPVKWLGQMHLSDCYQCGKCTAGYPVSLRMDPVPNRLICLLQIGEVDVAISSVAIWECVSCQTCSARCPKRVDCAGIMDSLRELSLTRRRVTPAARQVVDFQNAFLNNICRNGRLNEIELIAEFKLRAFLHTGRSPLLWKDAGLAPRMAARKKLHLVGEKVRVQTFAYRATLVLILRFEHATAVRTQVEVACESDP